MSEIYQDAFEAGKRWRTSGAYYESGVSNANVVKYGFSKWLPWDKMPAGIRKDRLLKAFREGYAAGKRIESKAGRRPNPQGSQIAYDAGFASGRTWTGSASTAAIRREYQAWADYRRQARGFEWLSQANLEAAFARGVKAGMQQTRATNPRTQRFRVKIPATPHDSTGYELVISAKNKTAARAEARKYCAAQWQRFTRLPQATQVTPMPAPTAGRQRRR